MDDSTPARVKDNDPEAVKDVLTTVGRWAYGRGLSRQDLEDLQMEVLEAVWQQADSFRGDASVHTWIISIAYRRWATMLRERQRKSASSLDATEPPIDPGDPSADPEDTVLGSMMAKEAIEKLLPEERDVLRWRLIEGLGPKDVAERMGRSVNAINCLKRRAMRKVGEYLSDFEGKG
jgi:RNA polymerase sigma-70 factor (ECF subfamily)